MTADARKPRIDPAWVALLAAAILLSGAIVWLMSARAPSAPPLSVSLAPLEARLAATEASLREIAERPPGNPEALAGLDRRMVETNDRIAQEITERLAALETTVTGHLNAGLSAAEIAFEDRLGVLEHNVANHMTESERLAAVAERELAARLQAQDQARQEGDAGLGQRLTNLETGLLQRLATLEQASAQRLASLEQVQTQRLAALEQAQAQRMAALEQAHGQRLAAMEQAMGQRLAPLEQALRRLSAAEARTERLAVVEALRTRLDAGLPLGPILPRLAAPPPPALARFAEAAPPTEPALRLGFEEALRQARGAAQEGALPRLNSLLTIRRGDDVVWGDASEAHVERARRALEAGDVEGALGHLGRLPEPVRQGMRGWLEQAQGLAAARLALRALAGG